MLRPALPPLVACCLVLSACDDRPRPPSRPDPAVAYCIQTGGQYENAPISQGRAGLCKLPDGRVVDAHAYHETRGAG